MLARIVNRLSSSSALHAALIVIFGLLAYANTFGVPFHFDDTKYIELNPIIREFAYVVDPSLTDNLDLSYNVRESRRTRMLGYLSFWANYRLNGLDTTGYHVVNTALHLSNALLLYLLGVLTFRTPLARGSALGRNGRPIALYAALLFAAHPLQTEAVTYISQRFTSLASLLCLASLACYAAFRLRDGGRGGTALYALALLSAAAAMFAKEIAFTLPAVIAAYELIFFRERPAKRALRLLPFFLTMPIIPLSVMDAGNTLGETLAQALRTQTDMPRSTYLLTEFRVLLTYLRLLLFPVNQNLDYDYPEFHSLFEPQVIASLLVLASILCLAAYPLLRRKPVDGSLRVASFGTLWFFLALSVESSVVVLADVIFEHRLYLPSAGAFLALSALGALALEKARGRRLLWVATVLLVLLPILLASLTVKRNHVWGSRLSLWEDTVSKSPRKARPRTVLGLAYLEEDMQEQYVEQFRKAVELDPEQHSLYNRLAAVYGKRGEHEKAIDNLIKALALKPDFAEAHNNLAVEYAATGQTEKALEHYLEAVRIDPGFAEARNNLGLLYRSMGKAAEAASQFRKALEAKPDYAEAHNNLGLYYYARGDVPMAQRHFKEAARLEPDLAEAHFNLGAVYLSQGLAEEARGEFREVLRIIPTDAEARRLLEEMDAPASGSGKR